MDGEKAGAITIGETTMLADLMACVIQELKVLPKAWDSMSKSEQDEVIERIEKQMREAADQAINIIASCGMAEVSGTVDEVKFKGGARAVITFASVNQGVHSLADAQGHFVKIIIPETEDLVNDSDKPVGEADQRALKLGDEYDDKGDGEPISEPAVAEDEEPLADALEDGEGKSEEEPED